jgi:ribA/ribD-fused uncharacterized protein
VKQIIDNFEEEPFKFMSNFFYSPYRHNDTCFNYVENGFQSEKNPEKLRNLLSVYPVDEKGNPLTPLGPGKAKREGRRCKLFSKAEWDTKKDAVMLEHVRLKFQHNPDLAKKLIATGDALLVEGNTWHDNYWGDCYCEECKNIPGRNQLGKILMFVREELRKK